MRACIDRSLQKAVATSCHHTAMERESRPRSDMSLPTFPGEHAGTIETISIAHVLYVSIDRVSDDRCVFSSPPTTYTTPPPTHETNLLHRSLEDNDLSNGRLSQMNTVCTELSTTKQITRNQWKLAPNGNHAPVKSDNTCTHAYAYVHHQQLHLLHKPRSIDLWIIIRDV